MLSVFGSEENMSDSKWSLRFLGSTGLLGSMGRKSVRDRKALSLYSCLFGTAQGDWEVVFFGPIHIAAVGADLLESTVLG